MTDQLEISFKSFAYLMWIEANRERQAYQEETINFENYVINNLDFLYDKYQAKGGLIEDD